MKKLNQQLLEEVYETLPKCLVLNLNRGASSDGIQNWEKQCRMKLTDELKKIYSWKNGAKTGLGFIPQYDFLSLESARIELKASMLYLDDNYFPIFGDGAGDFLCCDVSHKHHSGLFIMLKESPKKVTLAFDSLGDFFCSVSEAWKAQVFSCVASNSTSKQKKVMHVDFKNIRASRNWNEIFCRYNPRSAKALDGVAILNSPFSLKVFVNPHPTVFSDEEYSGISESFFCKALTTHFFESSNAGLVLSRVSKQEFDTEMQWFRQNIPMLINLEKALSNAKSARGKSANLRKQIAFLKAMEGKIIALHKRVNK